MIRKKGKILIIFFCLLFFIPSCFLGYIYYKVTDEASTRIKRGAVDRIIASESPVFYDDCITPIGVFFEKTHRKYIYYNNIPKFFVKALIAAEDKNFFDHSGFDLKAIIRAFIANIKAGKVVQGGSTLTQQTAKNIFKREKRSCQAKLKEMIQAFLFEKRYTKEEILEMYSNQFFVTGYGKGLRIAAQYYFDKEAEDLDLVEGAFIAGSVKGPNRYNPFIKKNEIEKEKAGRLAKSRKDYVLSKMLDLNYITEDQYLKAKERDVPFKEGKIVYRLNVLLDYIREQLASDYFSSILHELGVDNVATSGISIYTSVSKDIQKAALTSLRTNLPLMDVKLNGYNIKQMPEIYPELLENGLKKSRDGLPFLSRITHIDADRENEHLVVSWNHGGGIINYEGLKPIGQAWLKWKDGNQAVFDKKHVQMFLKNFEVGDLIPVQLAASPSENGEIKLMLSRIPDLEGGIVVVQKGMIRAMVGGYFNRFFNRSVDAKRQLGSIFKPILYTAALQLKWNNLDSLKNMKDVFKFESTVYLPRPDHTPKSNMVSMTWAGARSENLATVWLLYHLTDHLNMYEFRQIAGLVGLGRQEGESYLAYKKRIRDEHGVVVNRETMMQAAFEKSKKEIESDIIFGGHEEMFANLHRLNFNLDVEGLDFEEAEKEQISRYCFKRLFEHNQKMKEDLKKIRQFLDQYSFYKNSNITEGLLKYLRHFYRQTDNAQKTQNRKIIYTGDPGFTPSSSLIPLAHEWIMKNATTLSTGNIQIDGIVTSEIIDLLHENTKANFIQLLSQKRYDPETLSKIRDFRTLVNLSYVVYLSKKMGITTDLDPVLSFPLGPNSISIMEAALAYQTIMTGRVYPVAPGVGLESVPIITKIVDRDGEILWTHKPTSKKILSQRVCGLVTDILKKVMETGTGRKAKDAVKAFDIPLPTFGKTGTANRFINSSFAGFIPAPDDKNGQLDMKEGYVISSYVGYDDNRPMKGSNLAIYGASGALPLWIDTANAITDTRAFKKNLQPADLAFEPEIFPLPIQGNSRMIPVSSVTGLPVTLNKHASGRSLYPRALAEVEDRGDVWRLKRTFEPIGGVTE